MQLWVQKNYVTKKHARALILQNIGSYKCIPLIHTLKSLETQD